MSDFNWTSPGTCISLILYLCFRGYQTRVGVYEKASVPQLFLFKCNGTCSNRIWSIHVNTELSLINIFRSHSPGALSSGKSRTDLLWRWLPGDRAGRPSEEGVGWWLQTSSGIPACHSLCIQWQQKRRACTERSGQRSADCPSFFKPIREVQSQAHREGTSTANAPPLREQDREAEGRPPPLLPPSEPKASLHHAFFSSLHLHINPHPQSSTHNTE